MLEKVEHSPSMHEAIGSIPSFLPLSPGSLKLVTDANSMKFTLYHLIFNVLFHTIYSVFEYVK